MNYKEFLFNPILNANFFDINILKIWLKITQNFLEIFEKNVLAQKISKKVLSDLKTYTQHILQDLFHFIYKNNKFIIKQPKNYEEINDFFLSSQCHIYKFYSDATLIYGICEELKLFNQVDSASNLFLYWKFSNEKLKHYDMLTDAITGENKFFGGKNAQWFDQINNQNVPPTIKQNIVFEKSDELKLDIKKRWKIKVKDPKSLESKIKEVYHNTSFITGLENDLLVTYTKNIRYFISYNTKLICAYDFFKKIHIILQIK